jgi:hypothetical protein
MPDKTGDIRVRIERAKRHIAELNTAIGSFFNSQPYEVTNKRDPDTKRLIYYLLRVENTPAELSVIVGDALHNLRSALDHLMLLITLANGQPPGDNLYFPVSDSVAKHAKKQKDLLAKIGSTAAIQMDGIKPYKGGNDDLWRLHKLNNIHKHRLLVTVGSAFHWVDIGPQLHNHLQKAVAGAYEIPPIPRIHLTPANKMCPLKQGDELFVDAPGAEPQNLQFGLAVAFGEPGIAEGESVTDSFKAFVPLVEQIVNQFAPLL